jgi:glutamine cyclotransferase
VKIRKYYDDFYVFVRGSTRAFNALFSLSFKKSKAFVSSKNGLKSEERYRPKGVEDQLDTEDGLRYSNLTIL